MKPFRPNMAAAAATAIVTVAVLASAGPDASADSTPWHLRDWPYRRALLLAASIKTDLPGDEVCWAVIPTHGQIRSISDPIRVVSASGSERPYMPLRLGPGDQLEICFAAQPKAKKYFVYYGNSDAQAKSYDWQPRRGLLLSGRTYPGGPMQRLSQVQRIYRLGREQGKTFVPNVFFGYNPLGPPGDYVHHYLGWLICPADGTYTFATSSDDASWLLIDGKTVVAWPGQHRWRADAKHNGRVQLTRGLHRFEYWHINAGPFGGAVAAWQPPGAERIRVIPAKAFAPVARCEPGDLDRADRQRQPDFRFTQQGMAFFANRYSFRWLFLARMPGGPTRSGTYVWDFGDGMTSRGRTVEHIYLRSGTYTVTLTVTYMGKTFRISNRIVADIDWGQLIYAKLDSLDRHCNVLASENLAELEPALLPNAVLLADRADRLDLLPALMDLFATRCKSPSTAGGRACLEVLRRRFVKAGRLDKAIRWLASFEKIASKPAMKAAAAAELADVLLNHKANPAAALAVCRRVLENRSVPARSEAVRRVRILAGDAYVRLGNAEKAKQMYASAAAADAPQQVPVQVGALTRSAEDYIRRAEYDAAAETLRDLEWRYPTQKAVGYSSLLWARLYMAQKNYEKVTQAAQDLLVLNPGSNYAPDLLMLAAEAHRALGDTAKARAALQQIVERYRESDQYDLARKRLEEWAQGR